MTKRGRKAISGSGVVLRKTGTAAALAFLLFAGCASHRSMPQAPQIIVREMTYDENGLPAPGEPLRERPSLPGDHFTVASFADERLRISYDIAVVNGKADLRKPFQAVYEWTGKGFRVGAQASAVLMEGFLRGGAQGSDEAVLALGVAFAPLAIGGVTGFVIGIGDGVRQTALELRKFVLDDREQVLTCTVYEYDLRGRLASMRMFSPDGRQELVRTRFEYTGSGLRPERTVVESLVEGTQRNIR